MSSGWKVWHNAGTSSSDQRYVYLLDTIVSSKGSGQHTFSKTYHDYDGCGDDMHVICGNQRYYVENLDLDVSESFQHNFIPHVEMTYDRGARMTSHVICSRIDEEAPITQGTTGNAYGMKLVDGSGGIAYVPDARPLYFLQRYRGDNNWYLASGSSDHAGWLEVETWESDPPLCFWRAYETQNSTVFQPPTLTALPSRNAPTTRNYRWVVGCELGQGSAGASGGSWNSVTNGADYYVYVFEAYTPPRRVDYGIDIRSSSGNRIVVGDGVPLLLDYIIPWNEFGYSPESLTPNYLAPNIVKDNRVRATTAMPMYVENINGQFFFARQRNPYHGVHLTHAHTYPNGQNNDGTSFVHNQNVSGQWYQTKLAVSNTSCFVISCDVYDSIINADNI